MRLRALVLVAAAMACGKESVHEQTAAGPPWEEATPANGFKPVVAFCEKIDGAGRIQDTRAGSLQDIVQSRPITAIAADDRYVYFAERKSIYRAERATSPWPAPWKIETFIDTLADEVTDLAVTSGEIHWVSATDSGRTSRGHMDKATHTYDFAIFEDAPVAKLVVRGDTVFWSTTTGVFARRDGSAAVRISPTPSVAIAANEDDVFTLSSAGYFVTTDRKPWRARPSRSLVAPGDVVDAIADEHFLYWLERGPETSAADDCDRCTTAYRMKGQPQHAQGKLRRVPLHGGAPTDLYVGLPNVEHLTLLKGVLWVSTKHGLLRYDPTCHLPPARVAGSAGLHGRAVPFAETLAVLGTSPEPRVALLSSP